MLIPWTVSGFIPSYTHLQPWLDRVCWGYNYLITRGAPSCLMTLFCMEFLGRRIQISWFRRLVGLEVRSKGTGRAYGGVFDGEKNPENERMSPKLRDYFNREYIFQPLIFKGHVSFPGSITFFLVKNGWNNKNWVVVSKICYFHPENWGRFPFWLIFFKGLKPPTRKCRAVENQNVSCYDSSSFNWILLKI